MPNKKPNNRIINGNIKSNPKPNKWIDSSVGKKRYPGSQEDKNSIQKKPKSKYPRKK